MMRRELLGTFSVSQEFTADFAKLSGDFNPLHVDPVIARRYQFGSTVVHGICGTLKALDLLSEKIPGGSSIATLKIQFNKPIRHGDNVDVHLVSNENEQRLELTINGKKSQVINVATTTNRPGSDSAGNLQQLEPPQINDHSFQQTAQAKGAVDLTWNGALMSQLFPNVTTMLSPCQTATLLGTTVIVGMKCPGMNSIYGGLKLSFSASDTPFQPKLDYSVASSDERFNRLLIQIENSACSGEIEAFYRAPPVDQPSLKAIQQLVPHLQFTNQRALVIGGSRGLGEIIAKLLAAGGAKTTITYAQGKQDAKRVADEISKNGGDSSISHYNVLVPATDLTDFFTEGKFTHIYYLASPVIEKSEQPIWDKTLFDKYCSYYLTGLSSLLTLCTKNQEYRKSALNIFIPSTIFLSEPSKGFAEYCAAKAATETLAQNLIKSQPKWRVHAPRLPRMQTDQTSGIENRDSMEAANLMFKEISKLSS
jgi:acyl dehydratase